MNEWIVRVMPLPIRDPYPDLDPQLVELARFRMRIVPPNERPGPRPLRQRQAIVDVGPVRILALDSANPHGGVGGSLDSDQCAWLVRELDRARDRYVVVASHDSSRTMTSADGPAGAAPKVLGAEVTSILLAHPSVLAWVSGTMHDRSGRRRGAGPFGFWEIPGAATGLGAPLAGGISIAAETRHLHRVVVMRGALAGEAGPAWEARDPLPEVSAAVRRAPAVAPR